MKGKHRFFWGAIYWQAILSLCWGKITGARAQAIKEQAADSTVINNICIYSCPE
jgi:hypothetical protein